MSNRTLLGIIIVLLVIIVAGGAYWFLNGNTVSPATTTLTTASSTVATQAGVSSQSAQTMVSTQHAASVNSTTQTFTIPGTYTLTRGETITETGISNSVSITLTGIEVADGDVSTSGYIPDLTFSSHSAPDQSVGLLASNGPYSYGGIAAKLISATPSTATLYITSNSNSAAAQIDSTSLVTHSSNPVITGTATNAQYVIVELHTGTKVLSPDTSGNVGETPVINGHWSASFSSANLPTGTYQIIVRSQSNVGVLASATLTIQ